jgi:hypothetical protein
MNNQAKKFVVDTYANAEIGWRQAAQELDIWEYDEFALMLERNNIVRLKHINHDELIDIANFAKLFTSDT